MGGSAPSTKAGWEHFKVSVLHPVCQGEHFKKHFTDKLHEAMQAVAEKNPELVSTVREALETKHELLSSVQDAVFDLWYNDTFKEKLIGGPTFHSKGERGGKLLLAIHGTYSTSSFSFDDEQGVEAFRDALRMGGNRWPN